MKVSVNIPVYASTLPIELVNCLLTEQSIAEKLGITLKLHFITSCTNLAVARNNMAKSFLESDCDKLFFIDADVTFEPGALVKLVHYPVEIVGGAYPLKQDKEGYPVSFLHEELWANEMKLIPMKMIPTGFLSMARSAFERFMAAHPDRWYDTKNYHTREDERTYCFFQIPYANGALYTEDAYFCYEWLKIGGELFIDPEIELQHWNANRPYKGKLGDYLRKVMAEEKAKKPMVVLTPEAHQIAKQILQKQGALNDCR